MRTAYFRFAALPAAMVLAASLPVACGSSPSDTASPTPEPSMDGGPPPSGDAGPLPMLAEDSSIPSFKTGTVTSIAISPATVSLVATDGASAQQALTVTATYSDGTTSRLYSGIEWTAGSPQVGAIDPTGLFTASGSLGGVVPITVQAQGFMATASVTVKVLLHTGVTAVTSKVASALQAAATSDPSVVWAYPYDGTVYPRGLAAPLLMWNGGAATDDVYVHVTSPTFELEGYAAAPAPNANFTFDASAWERFVDSTSGDASVTVARWDGSAATVIAKQSWTIAPASMRGTIYYWAINTGRIMRIKPGAQADDMFASSGATCPSCHTASADGSLLAMNQGNWPDETSVTYNLQGATNAYSGLSDSSGASPFALGALSADGKVLVQNFAPLRGPIGVTEGAFNTTTGAQLSGTGLESTQLWMPSFSPDDKLLAYVTSNNGHWGGDLHAFDWNETTQQATSDRLIVGAGTNPATDVITMPTVSPDHQWVIYQRSNTFGSLGNNGDLYMASVGSPGTEIPLDALNGALYDFAAGARDQHLDFEPTFAPVAAGGYFWVVFHSRRTYGNALTGPAFVKEGEGTKQLWVAAIDQSPTPGKDPSHPAFWLPGQDVTTLNMRGFWALSPCEGNGTSCASGTDCCGGYCGAGSADAGGPVCTSQPNGCSNDGDRCTTTSDCCGAGVGVTCINSVCSEPTPK